MKLNIAIAIAAVAATVLFAGRASSVAVEQSVRPNVAVILCDDPGYTDVGFHGCKDIPTSNLDALAASPADRLPQTPGPEQNLVLTAPVNTWDEALPLGNGLMGGLLWGGDSLLKISLDRGDIWDERTHGEKEWWKKYNYAWGVEQVTQNKPGEVGKIWDGAYNGATPTKLPVGRLEISFDPAQKILSFELDLAVKQRKHPPRSCISQLVIMISATMTKQSGR